MTAPRSIRSFRLAVRTMHARDLAGYAAGREMRRARGVHTDVVADAFADIAAVELRRRRDEADAARILKQLSGQTHRVLTAVAVQKGRQRVAALSESWVRFAAMTPAQIKAYVATGEPMGKAGAYGVQGRAAAHIEQIRGSYSGIMGLPLCETAALLRQLGMHC